MKSKTGPILIVLLILLLILLGVLTGGALDVVKRGGGFLFVPSFTPTATSTNTATNTPTVTQVPTNTPTLTPTATETSTPTATLTSVPSLTSTLFPTYDVTALANKLYAEITETAEAYLLAQTPSVTPTIPASELYSGLKMENPADGKLLYYLKNGETSGRLGFWLDFNEVSNKEYSRCIASGFCSAPKSDKCNSQPYFMNSVYDDYPVVNITKDQAEAYCHWAGMELMTYPDWYMAVENLPTVSANVDRENNGPLGSTPERSDIIGNVWEWVKDENKPAEVSYIAGGSWKSSLNDVKDLRPGGMDPVQYAEDVGFRCVLNVYGEQ